MTYRIFISSTQREFAKERKAFADYIRKDMMFGGCSMVIMRLLGGISRRLWYGDA